MKKPVLLCCISMFLCLIVQAGIQLDSVPQLKVITYKLPNGLTVFLNEDHTVHKVFGAVVVKAGSNNESYDATGVAHYFEHIMFKGTDKIGTINWDTEKIFLDSIQVLYDSLGITTDDIKRTEIQKHINKISQKASDYAIPNEVTGLLKYFGGTGINAFTSYDRTAYINYFPSNQIETWMDIYAERFRNPVFRLFQSELETVYEEKNMGNDEPGTLLMEEVFKRIFDGHPAGHHSVIGLTEHLKNPSITKMYDFFNTYYVANNMALILAGDFSAEMVKPMIEAKFGQWKSKDLPEQKIYHARNFNGREVSQVKMLPVKAAILGFRGLPTSHPQAHVLELTNQLLSNQSTTGLVDRLIMNNKLMAAFGMNIAFSDAGANIVIIIPKILRQSVENAESLVLNQIQRLKTGDFDDDLLQSLKMEMSRNLISRLENPESRAMIMMDAFIEGNNWDEKLKEIELIRSVSKEDIVKMANQIFISDYVIIKNKPGMPKKQKLQKPPYEPLVPKNTELDSDFAKTLKEKKDTLIQPHFIRFGKDIIESDIRGKVHLYYTQNPVNDIFTLNLVFGNGYYNIPVLKQAAGYLHLIGSKQFAFDSLKLELQKIGATYNIYAEKDRFSVEIKGFDDYFMQTLHLVDALLFQPQPDDKQLQKFVDETVMNYKFETESIETMGDALKEFALYGQKSWYLNRLSLKEVKKLTSSQLLNAISEVTQYEVDIHYVGTLSQQQVSAAIIAGLSLPESLKPSVYPLYTDRKVFDQNTVIMVNDKKAIQSKIYLIRDGNPVKVQQHAVMHAFNDYFGSGMHSLIFQEVREFRSLSYHAMGTYNASLLFQDKPGYLLVYAGTQSDKTNEAIEILYRLTDSMPLKPDRIFEIKQGLMQAIDANDMGFRYRSKWVADIKKAGFDDDVRIDLFDGYKKLVFNDIVSFYQNNIAGKPTLLTIYGDKSKFNIQKLNKYGAVIEIPKKSIIKK